MTQLSDRNVREPSRADTRTTSTARFVADVLRSRDGTARGAHEVQPPERLTAFGRKGLALLREIEYRPVHTSEDLEALYEFRYRCYRYGGHVDADENTRVSDKLDDDPRCIRIGVWLEGRMVASLRLQLLTRDARLGPSVVAFPEIVHPMLDSGLTMIDPSRLTVDHEASKEHPLLPYLTVRLAAMASLHFDVDFCLSCVRRAHGAFYDRVIESKPIAPERPYPGLNFDVALYASDVRDSYDRVFSRFPFFHSLPSERRMLFGPRTPFVDPHATAEIVPTARKGAGGSATAGIAGIPDFLTVLPTAHLAVGG